MSKPFPCIIAIVIVGLAGSLAGAQPKRTPVACPAAGESVALSKVVSASSVKDYEHCDVVVAATFLKMGNERADLGKYNTKTNTTFQILEPGGTPQTRSGGRERGILAGTPNAKAGILSELKRGDPILLRGHPVTLGAFGKVALVIFDAESITRE